jgi:hypothetical protein
MSRLMNPEIREYAVRCYVERGMSPTEVVEEIAGKFNVRYRPTQMRQFLSRGGYSAQRRAVDRQVTKIISEAAIAEIAKSRAAKPEELLQEWARQLIAVTQKSLDAAAKSERVRDIASATSAAATAIRTFRNCSGLDAPPATKGVAYTYDFAYVPLKRASQDPGAVDVEVTAERPPVRQLPGVTWRPDL